MLVNYYHNAAAKLLTAARTRPLFLPALLCCALTSTHSPTFSPYNTLDGAERDVSTSFKRRSRLHRCQQNNIVAGQEAIDLVGECLECIAVLPLVTRTGVDRGGTVGDVRVTENDTDDMWRKSNIAQQCCHGAAEVVSVPSRRGGQPMQSLRFAIPVA